MPNQPDNRGRRVTDKQGVSFDAANQAVRMERIEGDHRLLQSQVKGAFDNMTGSMQSVQAEVRNISNKVGDFSDLRIAHEQDRGTMARIEKSIAELGNKVDIRLERMERENEDRWTRHEADNENADRDLQDQIDELSKRHHDTDRRISRAVGWVSGLSVTAALLIGGFVWAINFRFVDAKEDINRIEMKSNAFDALKDKVQQLELYLARGGQRPPEPYDPNQEKKQ